VTLPLGWMSKHCETGVLSSSGVWGWELPQPLLHVCGGHGALLSAQGVSPGCGWCCVCRRSGFWALCSSVLSVGRPRTHACAISYRDDVTRCGIRTLQLAGYVLQLSPGYKLSRSAAIATYVCWTAPGQIFSWYAPFVSLYQYLCTHSLQGSL
jgi:hypothetical protein